MSEPGITNVITKSRVAQLAKSGHEPNWLADDRLKAWDRFEKLPMPTLRDEQWRRTDLSALDFAKLTAALHEKTAVCGNRTSSSTTGGGLEPLLAIFNPPAAAAQFCGCASISVKLSGEAKAKDVVVTDLATACLEHCDLVRPYIEEFKSDLFDQDKFSLLNRALFDEGIFVYVPANVTLDQPILTGFELDTKYGAAFPRLIVAAGEGSSFKLINIFSSVASSDSLSNENNGHRANGKANNISGFAANIVQLGIGAGANVSYLEVQNFHDGNMSITRAINQISADARLNSLTVAAGGATVRSDILTELKAAGAGSQILGIVLGSGSEHYDFNTIVDHQAPDTTSDINFRVALKDTSSSVYQGTIKVDKQAQRTVAYQSNKNLLLSDRTHAASIPKLEILANDVKCSHGATVAAVDKDQVFYLNSRGLDRIEAEQLIVRGFLNQVVESFGWPDIVPWLESKFRDRLSGAIASPIKISSEQGRE